MYNVINIILKKLIELRIPDMILVAAFKPYKENRSISGLIKEKIITNIVLRDCNLYAGQVKKIVLTREYVKEMQYDPNIQPISQAYSTYEIPPDARENRNLTAVIDVAYPSIMMNMGPYPNQYLSGQSIPNLMDSILTSFTNTPSMISPTPILMANNIVRLEPPLNMHVDWILSCLLEYDSNFTNITPNMIEPLSELVVLATKSYIYNTLINDQELATVVSGSQFETFRSIIESYADAYDSYHEALLKFRGAATFDKEAFLGLINLMV